MWNGSSGPANREDAMDDGPRPVVRDDGRPWHTLQLSRTGEIAEVSLARPESRNALIPEMMRELIEAAELLDQSQQVRTVVLSGEGPSFCAGIDLGVMNVLAEDETAQDAAPASYELAALGQRMMTALRTMRPITVAAVQGHAAGGGLLLMMACDLRIVADDAQFWLPDAAVGNPLPWGGLPHLVAEVGPVLARDLILTCRRFSGTEAVAMALANRAVPTTEVASAARDLARTLTEIPVAAADVTKRHVHAVVQTIGASTAFADAYVVAGSMRFDDSRRASAGAGIEPGDRPSSGTSA